MLEKLTVVQLVIEDPVLYGTLFTRNWDLHLKTFDAIS
jgi:hypothetical protein